MALKYENLASAFLSLIIIAGAIMKINHWDYANAVLIFGLLASNFFQQWIIRSLKKNLNKSATTS